jgi:hypothetical protein
VVPTQFSCRWQSIASCASDGLTDWIHETLDVYKNPFHVAFYCFQYETDRSSHKKCQTLCIYKTPDHVRSPISDKKNLSLCIWFRDITHREYSGIESHKNSIWTPMWVQFKHTTAFMNLLVSFFFTTRAWGQMGLKNVRLRMSNNDRPVFQALRPLTTKWPSMSQHFKHTNSLHLTPYQTVNTVKQKTDLHQIKRTAYRFCVCTLFCDILKQSQCIIHGNYIKQRNSNDKLK